MATVIEQSGVSSEVGAMLPQLTGEFIPAIDMRTFASGLGIIVPWGGGMSIRESMLSSAESLFAGAVAPETQQITALVNSLVSMPNISNHNYYFEGLVGPQGVPGPPGPQGIGITNYVGGAGTPSSAITADIPLLSGFTWGTSGTNITWTSGTVRYKGTNYTISSGATTGNEKYVYWDKDTTPTQLLFTNTLANVLGVDKWMVCYNDGGTPKLTPTSKALHGGIIEASTIDAASINTYNLTAANATFEDLVVKTAYIDDLNITNPKIADNATAVHRVEETAAEQNLTLGSWVTVETISNLDSFGETINFTLSLNIYNAGSAYNFPVKIVKHPSTDVWTQYVSCPVAYPVPLWTSATLSFSHTPATGNNTYYAKVYTDTNLDKVSNVSFTAHVDRGK